VREKYSRKKERIEKRGRTIENDSEDSRNKEKFEIIDRKIIQVRL
jgi:hypothetical protein